MTEYKSASSFFYFPPFKTIKRDYFTANFSIHPSLFSSCGFQSFLYYFVAVYVLNPSITYLRSFFIVKNKKVQVVLVDGIKKLLWIFIWFPNHIMGLLCSIVIVIMYIFSCRIPCYSPIFSYMCISKMQSKKQVRFLFTHLGSTNPHTPRLSQPNKQAFMMMRWRWFMLIWLKGEKMLTVNYVNLPFIVTTTATTGCTRVSSIQIHEKGM